MGQVKDVRFARASSATNGTVGLCSVSFENGLIVYGVKIRVVNGSYRVLMPERRVGKSEESKSVVLVDSYELREEIRNAVLNQYFKELESK